MGFSENFGFGRKAGGNRMITIGRIGMVRIGAKRALQTAMMKLKIAPSASPETRLRLRKLMRGAERMLLQRLKRMNSGFIAAPTIRDSRHFGRNE
ncbi:predicted protein [Brucella abortus bv. 4 str. 292]|uniref:Uncharacterized protein n=4 Tax=Brucella abortus TaxID=235 RepID=Q2YMZ6_BRUA2|nr:hypothetical protein BruAb1_0647 [Brucella abortus bv. 1 str. 9-941]EEP64134.1 Hypothetical protein, conserved [Brucella abortus str. 2308 A]EEX54873.1 predicted protein [Brucella abortus bv. 4 str. 292]EEX58694.1 predicted protein [Brucella abortus bv. 2 str. 86/8/59]ERM05996.1 hypothetical protein P408_02875 [Brucella abortus S99]CAJ10607.1 conserved hypothetical protein [Brucella abortus 2308]SHO30457.1 predicted protein [Brucella abortus]